MKSGANPRQKLTDTELTVKMEQMKLLSAEKARKFEKAERDEKEHAAAYARGMDEARKRRAEEAERRRRGEDDKRKLDEERAKNRDRKLKAMGTKEGGWDEGKTEEEETKRAFRGANGGVRGSKRGGLGGSRYAASEEVPDVDRFLEDRGRGRGRGRGGRGRGAAAAAAAGAGAPPKKAESSAPTITKDEFPALPGDAAKATAAPPAAYPPKQPLAELPPPLPKGTKWDDEMEELDNLQQNK